MDLLPTLKAPEPFEPATGGKVFSLRDHLIKQGVNDLSSALNTAHEIIKTVPGVNLRRYRAAYPMADVHSG